MRSESVEGACDEAARQGVPIGSLRADAVRYSLFAVAVDDAFSGRSGLALYRSVSALLFRPWFALTSRGQALREKAKTVPQAILSASDCSVAELAAVKNELIALRDRLNSAFAE